MVCDRRGHRLASDAVPRRLLALGRRRRARAESDQKPVRDLLEPLDYLQGAPTGFLLAEKAIVEVLGDDELALRLFPLCPRDSLALPLRCGRATRSGTSRRGPRARAVRDCGAAGLLLIGGEAVLRRCCRSARAFLRCPRDRLEKGAGLASRTRRMWPRAWSCGSPTRRSSSCRRSRSRCSYIRPQPRRPCLQGCLGRLGNWGNCCGGGVSGEPTTPAASPTLRCPASQVRGWLDRLADPLRDLWHAFADPVGLARTTTALALIACVLGGITLARLSLQRALVVVTPIAATLAASILDLYPFGNRFILFLVPFFLLLVGAGLEVLMRPQSRAAPLASRRASRLSYPVARAVTNLMSPPDMRN